MKVKISITLSEYILNEIDKMIDEYGNRSILIEEAIKEFINRRRRQLRDLKDLELINNNAEYLNKEVKDTLSYQVEI